MSKKSFNVGEEVRLTCDRKNRYRYVGRNVVRNIETGRIMSVKSNQIKKVRPAWYFVFDLLLLLLLGSIAALVHQHLTSAP